MSNKLAFNPLSGKFDYVNEISDADVTSKRLTGYVSGAGTVAATDNILQAIQKLNGNVAAIASGGGSSSGGSGIPTESTVDPFTGDGTTDAFTLSVIPPNNNAVIVNIGGLTQLKTSYSIVDATLTFTEAPYDGAEIEVIILNTVSVGGSLTTEAVQTVAFTAVASSLYPVNTTSTAITATLPATATAGDQIGFVDYAGTFETNTLTIAPNSLKINGGTSNLVLALTRESVTLTYVDATQGWVVTSAANEAAPSATQFDPSILLFGAF